MRYPASIPDTGIFRVQGAAMRLLAPVLPLLKLVCDDPAEGGIIGHQDAAGLGRRIPGPQDQRHTPIFIIFSYSKF